MAFLHSLIAYLNNAPQSSAIIETVPEGKYNEYLRYYLAQEILDNSDEILEWKVSIKDLNLK